MPSYVDTARTFGVYAGDSLVRTAAVHIDGNGGAVPLAWQAVAASASVPGLVPSPRLSPPAVLDDALEGSTQGAATNVAFDTTSPHRGSAAAVFGSGATPSAIVEPNTPNLSAATIDFWFRPATNITNSLAARQGIVGYSASNLPTGAGGNWDKDVYLDTDGAIAFYVSSSRSSVIRSTTRTWRADTWYHITASVGGAGQRLFVDGVQQAIDTTINSSVATGSYFLNIGRAPTVNGTLSQFSGVVDDVRVFPVDLAPDQTTPVADGNWLSVDRVSGSLCTSCSETFMLRVNPTGLGAAYRGRTTSAAIGSINSPQTVFVSLVVEAPPRPHC
jgi:hypothetical protein